MKITSRQRVLAAAVVLALGAPIILGVWALRGAPAVVWGATPPLAALDSRSTVGGADSILASLGNRAPFRATRRPSDVSYDPLRADPQFAVLHQRPPVPVIALSGIVFGQRSAALIEGIPGRERVIPLGVGDSAGGVRVLRIHSDRVVLIGFDTTWTLTVRRPW
jgi:hypothetical protein